MYEEKIAEIGIDEIGGVYLKPSSRNFDYIYRAAMQIYWDRAKRRLFSPAAGSERGKLSQTRWLQQILDAAADEYGVTLVYSNDTIWLGISDTIKSEMLEMFAIRKR